MGDYNDVQNNRIKNSWKDILKRVFEYAYINILTSEEIMERINYVVDNIENIPAINLFKCILYSDTRNEVGKLALDYRIQFIGPNYKNCISTGESFELDTIDFHEKHILMKEIKELCIALNYSINSEIASGKKIDIVTAIDFLADIINIEHREHIRGVWNLHEDIQHFMSYNQIIYSVVFNQNPLDGKVVSKKYSNYIKKQLRTRCMLFERLKIKYPTGIRLSLVSDKNFFG